MKHDERSSFFYTIDFPYVLRCRICVAESHENVDNCSDDVYDGEINSLFVFDFFCVMRLAEEYNGKLWWKWLFDDEWDKHNYVKSIECERVDRHLHILVIINCGFFPFPPLSYLAYAVWCVCETYRMRVSTYEQSPIKIDVCHMRCGCYCNRLTLNCVWCLCSSVSMAYRTQSMSMSHIVHILHSILYSCRLCVCFSSLQLRMDAMWYQDRESQPISVALSAP